ncbi:MAG: DUF4342 domain-containing protein [Eubacterium sp.]|nr:DUF4342 domain-containing protein [Eubacterium sp.]
MEVTLEKIELVKDRTGVTYKEAKEALEAADGNVVDAIVSIEDKTDGQTSSQKLGETGNEIIDKIKDVVNRGNAARIRISKDDQKLLDLPLNAGVIGAIVAPWGIILGVAASFGFNCKIEVVKEDGSVVDVTDKAGNLYEQAMEKGNEVVEQVKEKAPDFVDQIKEKGEEAVNQAKAKGEEVASKAKEAADKFTRGKNDAAQEAEEAAEDAAEEAAETVDEIAEDIEEKQDL